MAITQKDTIATGMVAVAVVVYFAFLAFDGVPIARDVKGMAAVGLVLGFASRRIGGRAAFRHAGAAFAAGLASLALGIVALITASEIVLALFVASMVGLWTAAMYAQEHSVSGPRTRRSPRTEAHR